MIKIGLIGNPNCGKTTLFNLLTGKNAHVGNWPGVTVERKEGLFYYGGKQMVLVDIPGIYSLSPYSPEEGIARNFLLEETPDLLLNIIDASNLERSLYLTTQILEMDCPVILILNMIDAAEKQGIEIDMKKLSSSLYVPVLPISAAKNIGIENLKEAIWKEEGTLRFGRSVLSSSFLAPVIENLYTELKPFSLKHKTFFAGKLLENDPICKKLPLPEDKLQQILKKRDSLLFSYPKDIEGETAAIRYQFIDKILLNNKKPPTEEKLDALLTHTYWGIPVFLLLLFLLFHFTFSTHLFGIEGLLSPGAYLKTLAEETVSFLYGQAFLLFQKYHASPWLYGLFLEGVLKGVGAILSFLPQILCLFLGISLMEDSGYMARVAFLLDRPLGALGLSGKAFLPLMMGFGCSVPAMLASRTLEDKKERLLTLFLIPHLSCGAKLPIYVLFSSVFFPQNADMVLFFLYLLGVAAAILSALLLKNTVLKKERSPLLLELPAYHMPSAKNILRLLWEKVKEYLTRAGTLIFSASVIIWVLSNFTFSFQYLGGIGPESMLGQIGAFLQPFFSPLGFASQNGGWKEICAILSGFIAKEAVVSTLGILSEGTAGGLFAYIAQNFTAAGAVSFMVFNLLCTPCMAAVSTFLGEAKSIKWTVTAFIYWFLWAWILSFFLYRFFNILW